MDFLAEMAAALGLPPSATREEVVASCNDLQNSVTNLKTAKALLVEERTTQREDGQRFGESRMVAFFAEALGMEPHRYETDGVDGLRVLAELRERLALHSAALSTARAAAFADVAAGLGLPAGTGEAEVLRVCQVRSHFYEQGATAERAEVLGRVAGALDDNCGCDRFSNPCGTCITARFLAREFGDAWPKDA